MPTKGEFIQNISKTDSHHKHSNAYYNIFSSDIDSQLQYARTLQNALNAGMIFPEVEINFDSLEVYRLVDYSEKENAGISHTTWN